MARDDLPASLAGSAVVRPEDRVADSTEHAKEQVTEGLAQVGISGMVQHSEYTFECAGWVGGANVRPNLFSLLGCFLPSCSEYRPGSTAFSALAHEAQVTVQEHCRRRSTRCLTLVPYTWECLSVPDGSQPPICP